MIYDMRIYDVQPGAVPRHMEAVRDTALKIREDHGVKPAGWYYTDIGPLNRIVHIWAYQDYAHFQEAREAVRNDPRWTGEYLPRRSTEGSRCSSGQPPRTQNRLGRRRYIRPLPSEASTDEGGCHSGIAESSYHPGCEVLSERSRWSLRRKTPFS